MFNFLMINKSSSTNIIGVCLDNSNTSVRGTFSWIDVNGNKVSSFNYTKFPTFANISMTYDDLQRNQTTLTRIPLFYIKTTTSGPAGSYAAGKKCWWISDKPYPEFRPHPCFKRSTSKTNGKYTIFDNCYIGTYMADAVTINGKTCLGSAKGKTVYGGQSLSNYKTYINNKNNSSNGISGYRMFDIYDLSAIRYLSLIAKADTDTQKIWGDNNNGAAFSTSGSTNAKIMFNEHAEIDDLWRCFWHYVDLVTFPSNVVNLKSPMDLSSNLSFNTTTSSRYTQPSTAGWIRDVLDCPFTIGDDIHDLMELFLPGQVVSDGNLATFSDRYACSSPKPMEIFLGGYYDLGDWNGNAYGLYSYDEDPDLNWWPYNYTGTRICKTDSKLIPNIKAN